jgi:N-acetylglutamate synthase-like GNAT family acetyltransferase
MGRFNLANLNAGRRFSGPPLSDGVLPPAESTEIRTATVADLKFVDSLQKKFAGAVGFLPKVAIENLTEAGHVRLAMQNDEPAGYILSRTRLHWQPNMRSITQACVAMDAQRRAHGLRLLRQIEQEARLAHLEAIQACCAVGLDSNEFWRAAGFLPICHMRPANVRGREIICWRKPLVERLPTWFAMPPRLAGHRAKKPETSRDPNRSMDAALIAQRFLRGKSADTAERP